ncbi:thioesterase family protein [Psychrosphaera sp. B3R10]|uniref:Medium/long-chain acyl-CoA thioesterase YigI n=1 Tax=Psychrosphaera algicola TaxID=3023714 RepID=A0ABT5FFF2_9GAMM|nr:MULTISPECIES: thioesterase family protein [unclassified Psychrosphaera]MBU2883178.1 thioesterase family protein [Psychrosphaera sp. I2R16]MBU2988634.1 thioesterase family protein [Psychrosphaera sp. B3R10]MDC2890283.1 thioesterase family protein [Psychrosphaera sp. G1-22]MDO6719697.1 thioesterase family protein [Psychrosphaera sp. 1_MG-2023]
MLSNDDARSWLVNVFTNLNFNKNLGLKITVCEANKAEIRFVWDDKLMGNPMQKILHGGVTASALDTVGGILAIFSRMEKMHFEDSAALIEFTKKVGTIDLRTDYLRPGRGDEFIATAQLIRSGSRVCVTRMELHNQKGDQIAFGTGTYLVG